MTVAIENTPAAWDARATSPTSWQAGLMSERGQLQRFVAVLRHMEFRTGDTLLDFGCGTGRFSELVPRGVHYAGFDWSSDLLARAGAEHPRATFTPVLSDVMFDHVVAIGPFNLADNWSKDETWRKLSELWGMHVRRTLVVSLYRGDDPLSLYYSPEELCAFAGRVGCSKFVLDTTYLPNDLLLAMRR